MKINWKEVAKHEGYKKLKKAVLRDTNKRKHNQGGENCFNPTGCNHEFTRKCPADEVDKQFGISFHYKQISKCQHRYCKKFKWIIDKAKKFSLQYDLDIGTILDIWEKDRGSWYMNHYQPCFLSQMEKRIIEYLSVPHPEEKELNPDSSAVMIGSKTLNGVVS